MTPPRCARPCPRCGGPVALWGWVRPRLYCRSRRCGWRGAPPADLLLRRQGAPCLPGFEEPVNYLIVIAVAGKPAAVERLIERIDGIVETTTMEGGIDGLATEVVKGAQADAARERIRGAAKAPTKRGAS